MKTVFTEKQQFRQWWMILLILIPTVLIIIGFVMQVMMGKSFGDNPAPNWVIFATMGFVLLLDAVLIVMKLETRIDDEGVHYRWRPFMANYRTITWGRIAEARVDRYPFVGYGWRLSLRYGIVHNIAGQTGLILRYDEKRKMVLGTQQGEAMAEALKNFRK